MNDSSFNEDSSARHVDRPKSPIFDSPLNKSTFEGFRQNRQLIFASHNANLVVNGDAELVAWCDYRMAGDQSRGTIVGEGAIDIPGVREAIKKIMEGGEAAFHLRKAKYGF